MQCKHSPALTTTTTRDHRGQDRRADWSLSTVLRGQQCRRKLCLLRQHGNGRNATSGRLANSAYRIREHLTDAEMEKLLAALKRNRHGHRDWLIGLLIYRHGLRVSEACDLRWDDLDLAKRTIIVRRLKGSSDSTHYLERDEG